MMLADFQTELHGLTDEQIERGYSQLPKGWQPEVKEFRSLCLGESLDTGLTHNTAAYKPFDKSKAIEYKGDRNLAKSSLAKAKEILGATA